MNNQIVSAQLDQIFYNALSHYGWNGRNIITRDELKRKLVQRLEHITQRSADEMKLHVGDIVVVETQAEGVNWLRPTISILPDYIWHIEMALGDIRREHFVVTQ